MQASRETLRELLRKWGGAVEYCCEKQREITDLQALWDDLSEPLPRGAATRGQGKGAGDPTARIVAASDGLRDVYADSVSRLNGLIAARLALKNALDDALSNLPERQRDVLRHRYQAREDWADIAYATGLSQSRVKHLEACALDALGRVVRKGGEGGA